MSATVADVVALGEQLREEGITLSLDNNAAAVAFIKVSSRAPVVIAIIGSFRGRAAEASASCWVEGVSSEANPADALGRIRPLPEKPGVKGK